GDKKYPTIMLEAVASQDLWIWHAFYEIAVFLPLSTVTASDFSRLRHASRFCPVLIRFCHGVIKKYPTIMLEAVASQDLWILHAFYGIAGVNNDINVFDNSSLFDDLLDDLAHVVSYVRHESARKDVERAFGVLQGRWGLIQQPARAYEVNTLRRIMYAGIIMHNMILEDQNMSIVDLNHVYYNPARSMQTMWIDRCETQRRKAKEIRDRDAHISLQQNLINHIWREVEEASEED
nr:putative nuclease HARBI1 isoform X2 [Tanacetum cinerariifolium]